MLNKKDFLSGSCLFILGLVMAIQTVRSSSLWSRSGPEEGFFPFLIAIIIVGLSLFITVRSLASIRQQRKEMEEKQEKNVVDVFKISTYLVMMVLYGVLIQGVGFMITSTLFLIFILKYAERQGWKITISVALASVIIGYFVFVFFLKVPLPRGLVKWL